MIPWLFEEHEVAMPGLWWIAVGLMILEELIEFLVDIGRWLT